MIEHPVSLVAIATMIANDHYLKYAYPSWFTGKLSDVAGLVFFPALLACAGIRLGAATVITAVTFLLVKTWLPATDAFAWLLGTLQSPLAPAQAFCVADATDLVAMPFVLTSWLLGRQAVSAPRTYYVR